VFCGLCTAIRQPQKMIYLAASMTSIGTASIWESKRARADGEIAACHVDVTIQPSVAHSDRGTARNPVFKA
jgi:hypothetical protein